MLAERREEAKRFQISRPIEMEGGLSGTTFDMSDGGIRARFPKLRGGPTPGANVLLRLAWDASQKPVEQRGRIVWTAPEVGGEGMDVGLIVMTDDVEPEVPVQSAVAEAIVTPIPEMASLDEPQMPSGMAQPSLPEIEHGRRVMLSVGGIAMEAIVFRIGDMDDSGEVAIRLQIVDSAFEDVDVKSPVLTPEEENVDFTAHPIRDFLHTVRKYSGPLPGWIETGSRFSWKMLKNGYARVPQKHRDRVETLVRRGLQSRAATFVIHHTVRLKNRAVIAFENLH